MSQPEDHSNASFVNSPPHSPLVPGTGSQDALVPLTPSIEKLLPPPNHPPRPSITSDDGTRNSVDQTQSFSNSLERADRAIEKERRLAPDPFVDSPAKPFGVPVESISSLVDEKSNPPLNKAIASVNFLLPVNILLLVPIFLFYLNFFCCSSLMPTVESGPTLSRNCRASTLRTQRPSCQSRNS